jgi:hypothetical protein
MQCCISKFVAEPIALKLPETTMTGLDKIAPVRFLC